MTRRHARVRVRLLAGGVPAVVSTAGERANRKWGPAGASEATVGAVTLKTVAQQILQYRNRGLPGEKRGRGE